MTNPRLERIITLAAFLALSACGGGGSDSGGGEPPPPPPPTNQPPVASFVVTPTSGTVPMAVTVDAAQSRDPDGSIVRYAWDFGDGETSDAGVFLTHVYQGGGGTLTVSLTVTDDKGATATTTRQITAAPNDLSGPVAITLASPAEGLVPDEVLVTAAVTSTYEINRVTARLAGQEVVLRFGRYVGADPGYAGTFSLAGQGLGPFPLEIRAEDSRGNVDVLTVSVVHDNPPRIDWVEPVDFSVALPTLPLDVRCVDDLPGCTLQVLDDYGTLRQGTSPQTGTLDLTARIGKRDVVQVLATDRSGQVTREQRTVYPEDTARLDQVAEVPGRILDVDARRVLFLVEGVTSDELGIYDRIGGGTESIALPDGWKLGSWPSDTFPWLVPGKLVPGGAVFNAHPATPGGAGGRAYWWRSGVLGEIGPDNGFVASVADRFVLVTNYTQTSVLDTNTGLSRSVAQGDFFETGMVAPNGTVVYAKDRVDLSDFQIVRDDAGTQSVVAQSAELALLYPVVDDGRVAYFTRRPVMTDRAPRQIRLMEGGVETLLGTEWYYEISQPRYYQLLQGWVAYADTGDSGIVHVYTRDPLGMVSRRTDLSVSTLIDTLGEGGDLMVVSGTPSAGSRYYTRATSPFYVSSAEGRSYEIDGQWYVSIGRALLAVDTSE